MPLRLDIKRKLTARSDRVKSADLHPTEPWMVVSLYSGTLVVWNFESQAIVKTFELCDLPVRVAKFIARKHWLIAGADDMQIRVFNYNTLERVYMFEAHSDYIRCIAVHPTQPYILTSSDDMLIKLWDWEKKWVCSQVFEGHTHYVMQIVINPKDNNQFASASLDRTIKVWQLGSKTPNFTLEGHEKGVNCIDYYSGGDKPYLISGADDRLVKIWDYQNKTCVQTLEGHAQNVTCVNFHPELPIILTGSEDGTVRLWHSNTYRLENTLNYGMERVWCICGQQGSNSVALGYDEGSIIIKLGREEPAMSMDSSGKIMWARHSEVQQANLKAMGDTEINDGERLPLGIKDMGSCEIYPQSIQHSPNGRFVVVCGDGEYIIYTAMALRNKSFGAAQEFVWAHDSSQYAIREGNSMVKIFKNFKQKKAFKPDFGAEGIFGGFLLGVRSNSGLAFFDWETTELIRRIEIQPKHIFWSDSGELVCLATDESYFLLRYLPERVLEAQESKQEMTEDGIEDAFEVLGEVQETVKTGLWVGDCFIYTSSVNRLNYYVGGEIITIAHMDRTMYLLGYIPKDDRLYLGDKELNVISYSLLLSMLEYQTAVMRKDFSTADKVLPTIPKEQRTRVALFLEKQGFNKQALAVSTDPEHKFELALQLGELKTAYQLAQEAESEHKWKQLAELATTKCQFSLAQECLHQAQDYGGLLLLATTSGNAGMVGKLAEATERDGKTNVAFLTYFMQGRVDKCLDLLIKTERLPEAAFLARTYMPSQVPRVVKLWKESLSKVNQKAADALADPTQYSNLFPGLQQALLAEQYLKETHVRVRPAAEYPLITPNEDRNVLEESEGFMPTGEISVEQEVKEPIDMIPAFEETTVLRATTLQEVAAAPEVLSAGPEELDGAPEVLSAGPEALTAGPVVLTASPEVLTASPEVLTASPEALTAGPEVLSAGPEALTAGPEALSAGPVVLSAGPEVLTAGPEVLDGAPEAFAAGPELLSAGPEALTAGPVVLTASPEVLTAGPEVLSAGPEVLSAGPEVLTAGPEELDGAPEAFAAGPEVLTVGPEELSAGPEALSAGPEVLTVGPEEPDGALAEVTVTEKHVERTDLQSVSSAMEAVSETLACVGEDILPEPLIDIPPKDPAIPDMGHLILQEDASGEIEVQETSLEAAPAAADDVHSEALAAPEAAPTEKETDLMSSEVLQMTHSAASETEEDQLSPDLVPETAPSHVTVDELISFETSAMDAPVPSQDLSGLVFDPLLEQLEDPIKPVQAQERDHDELTGLMLPVKTEDKSKPLVVPKVEPETVSLLVAPEEGAAVRQKEGVAAPEECEEPAEDLEAELSDEGLDDLDLDNFDLEDIDTSDVNLDEDFLGE